MSLKNNAKKTEIGVDSTVLELAELNTDIRLVGQVQVQHLEWDGVKYKMSECPDIRVAYIVFGGVDMNSELP